VAGAVVEAQGVRRSFGRREVLGGVDLVVERGERVALRGPNGSGKSTLLRCVLGSIQPSAGTVLVCGEPAGTLEARRRIGATLSQDRSFYLRLSGRDNLLFFARLRLPSLRAARAEVQQVVDELEIGAIAAQRVSRCSTGMTQQLGFARALLGAPAALLLDEPTRSLDEGATAGMWAALDRRPDLAVLIATHRDEDVTHCHRTHDLAG
jgi:ABC-type multidrug transport system ATPase subunit